MKNHLNTNNYLKIYLQKYKDFIIPVSIIMASLCLFFFFVIPEFQSFIKNQQEMKKELDKLLILKNNLNLLTSLDDNILKSQLTVVKRALPPVKDYTAVVSAISYAANKANISLGGYEFEVGDLDKPVDSPIGYPTLKITTGITSNLKGLKRFLEELERTVPISEVTTAANTSDVGAITVLFYYKSPPPKNFREDVPIRELSPSEISLLQSLAARGNQENSVETSIPVPTNNSFNSSTGPF